ncbi:MAG TPA: amino acid adenylation domain-containing protein, partial [Longimicrobium sp.]|nr:amino acid adenylation domain-containing protein [Longimicrobium sp.]
MTSPLEDVYPLSPMQEGMLLDTLRGEPGAYVAQFGFTIHGNLDTGAFRSAWQGVVDRHPALRAAFRWERVPRPLQAIRRRVALPIRQVDLSAHTRSEADARFDAFVLEERRRGFDLERAPLMRVALFRIGEREHRVVWTHHHILLDGWSVGLVYDDLLALYEAHQAGRTPELPETRPFRDYIAWLESRDLAGAEAYWRVALHGVRAATPLGITRPEPAPPAGEGTRAARLEPVRAAALEERARALGVTLATLVHGAWALVLSRYSGHQDVVFGTTVAARPPSLDGVERMVGNFVNTVPLRASVDPDAAAAAFLRALHAAAAETREHEHAPLARVQGWSGAPGGEPLFETLVSVQTFPRPAGGAAAGVEVRDAWGREEGGYPVTLAAEPAPGGGLMLDVSYARPRLSDGAAERLLGHLGAVLDAFAASPGARLREISLLTDAERAAVIARRTPAPPRRAGAVHEAIVERAARWPHGVAAIRGDERITYAELEERSGRLAAALRRAGVGPEVPVALFLDRSPELAVALLGVLRAGGFFIPLDPANPPARLAYLLADSGAGLVLTRASLAGALPAHAGRTMMVDAPPAAGEAPPGPAAPLDPDHLAYAIYTSGSTGAPRAAMISHRALLGYAGAFAAELALGPDDRVLQFASPAFDVMVEEIFPAWLSGAAVVFPRGDAAWVPERLLEEIETRRVTCLELPTAFWHEWVRVLAAGGARLLPAHVRWVIVGGERVHPERLREWARLGVPLMHVFGLTETSVTSTTLRLPAGEDGAARWINLPVGLPLPGVELHVLDGGMLPVPVGVPGELYIGGAGVARGYRGRPAATAARFVPHPQPGRPGERLYRTGDRVRWLEDGTLEFLGRTDHQLRIRGFRVEPAEVEAALATLPSVRAAAVDARTGAAGEPVLAAYVVPADGYRPGPAGLEPSGGHARPPVSWAAIREHL